MPHLIGILHPYAFTPSDISQRVARTYDQLPFSQPKRFFRSQNLEIGAWNLSIYSHSKRNIWLFYSGTLLNQKELEKELKETGACIQENTPQALITHAYETWGESFLKKIDGPFLLALYDEKKEKIILALDRMGQKSLYWTDQGKYLLFASDLKGLLATGLVAQTPETSALSSYLHFGYIPQDLSAIASVNKLLPGHCLILNLKRHYHLVPYWSLSQALSKQTPDSFENAQNVFGKHLNQQTPSHQGKQAFLLSESLGSTLLNWSAYNKNERPQTLSITPFFEETEKQFAENTCKQFEWNANWAPINLDTILDQLPKIVWFLDEPIASLDVLKTWTTASALQNLGVDTLTTDCGFNELFANHNRYFIQWQDSESYNPPFAYDLAHLPPKLRQNIILPFTRLFFPNLHYRILRLLDINYQQVLYFSYVALFKGPSRKFVSPNLYKTFDPEVFAQRFHKMTLLPGSLNTSLYFDLKTLLPDNFLFQYERILPMMGIHLKTPFLTNPFLEFAAHLPDALKLIGTQPGQFARDFAKSKNAQFPFSTPTAPSFGSQFSENPRLRKLFFNLKRGKLVEEGLLSVKWIDHQLRPKKMTQLAFEQLWALLIMELWFNLFVLHPLDTIDPSCPVEDLFR